MLLVDLSAKDAPRIYEAYLSGKSNIITDHLADIWDAIHSIHPEDPQSNCEAYSRMQPPRLVNEYALEYGAINSQVNPEHGDHLATNPQ